jgi:hypothetical protein
MIDRDAWPLVLVVCGVAFVLFGCPSKPGRPLPYETNERQKIDIIDRDYDVSRFWSCGWGSTCPMKTWVWELRVTPKEPIQSLLWLQRSRVKYDTPTQRLIDPLLVDSPSPQQVRYALVRALEQEEKRLEHLQISKEPITTLQYSIAMLDRIVSGDRAAAQEVMNQTSEGLLFHASYRIDRAGKSDQHVLNWWLLVGPAP